MTPKFLSQRPSLGFWCAQTPVPRVMSKAMFVKITMMRMELAKGIDRASVPNTTLASAARMMGRTTQQQVVPPHGRETVPAIPKVLMQFLLRSQQVLKHLSIVAIPITLEALIRIVLFLQP